MTAKPKEVAAKSAKIEIMPIQPREFQLIAHAFASYSAYVPAGTKKADLVKPRLWANIARQLRVGDEIRAMPDDMSFVARLVVTYQMGGDVRVICESFTETNADVNDSETLSKFSVVPHGRGKWAVKNSKTGDLIAQDLPSQSVAYRQMEDHVRALTR